MSINQEDEFAIHNVSQRDTLSNLNKSTLNLTFRNVTYQIQNPTDPAEDPYTQRSNSLRISDTQAYLDYTTNSQSFKNKYTIESYIKLLKSEKEMVKALFFVMKCLLMSYVFMILTCFDKKRIFYWSKLIPVSISIFIAIENGYRFVKYKIKYRRTEAYQLKTAIYLVKSLLFLFISAYALIYFYFIMPIDNKLKFLLGPLISLFFFLVIILVYTAIHRIEITLNLFMILGIVITNIILIQYYLSSLNIGSIKLNMICWPLFGGAVFAILMFAQFLKLIGAIIKYLEDNLLLVYVFLHLFYVFILFFLALYCLNGVLINAYFDDLVVLNKAAVLVGSTYSIFALLMYPLVKNYLDKEIKKFSDFESRNGKVKMSVPYFMAKGNTENYFQKLGKQDIQKIQEKSKLPKFDVASVKKEKEFMNVKSARPLTLKINQKNEVQLLDGVKTSIRTYRKSNSNIPTNKTNSFCISLSEQDNIVDSICKTQRELSRNQNDVSFDRTTLEEDICVVCYSEKSDIVIMQCGHSDICEECAKDIWKSSDVCFICQQKIDYIAKTEKYSDNIVKIKYCIYLK